MRMCASCDLRRGVVTRQEADDSYDRSIAGRRSYGTGSLFVRRDSGGQEKWYAQFRSGGRLVKRALGRKRAPGTRDGLTRAQAEAALRRLVDEVAAAPPPVERLGVAQAGARYLHHLEVVMGRKKSTIQDNQIMPNRHLAPFFGERALERVKPDDVVAYMAAKRRARLSSKTINHHL